MFRRQSVFAVFLLSFVLGACTIGIQEEAAQPEEEEIEQAIPTLPPEELITRNVTYTGLLEEGGIAIYQEGSHRLTLSDGKMVLLQPAEGTSVSLALYVGKLVRAQGDVMPTVEAGGTLMQVRTVEWIRREKDAEGKEAEVMRVLCGGGAPPAPRSPAQPVFDSEAQTRGAGGLGGGGCPTGFFCRLEETGGICIEEEEKDEEEAGEAEESPSDRGRAGEEAEEVEDEAVRGPEGPSGPEREEIEETEEIEESESMNSSASVPAEEGEDPGTADAQVTAMAEEDIEVEHGTQQYCSAHAKYCISFSDQWYFKAFGTTSSSLWHVEVGAQPVENLGDGPLMVDLKAGDLSALSVTDGAVVESGGKVTGYRTWSDNRRFEISADVSLKDAVTYITKNLKVSE